MDGHLHDSFGDETSCRPHNRLEPSIDDEDERGQRHGDDLYNESEACHKSNQPEHREPVRTPIGTTKMNTIRILGENALGFTFTLVGRAQAAIAAAISAITGKPSTVKGPYDMASLSPRNASDIISPIIAIMNPVEARPPGHLSRLSTSQNPMLQVVSPNMDVRRARAPSVLIEMNIMALFRASLWRHTVIFSDCAKQKPSQ